MKGLSYEMSDKFEPIPSLNNLYEINPKGVVRSAKLKRVLNSHVYLCVNGQKRRRSIEDLLWEVFGTRSKKKRSYRTPLSTDKDGEKYYFGSLKECANFLTKKTFYSINYLKHLLSQREKNIFGWKIKYWDEPDMIAIHH